mmetsp:Transcript_63989/g.176769  ORF Transcript_63989/g.176769 Transcript_63989/m.176769 type:complete len:104 (-) Transcript_63989:255-566(-)
MNSTQRFKVVLLGEGEQRPNDSTTQTGPPTPCKISTASVAERRRRPTAWGHGQPGRVRAHHGGRHRREAVGARGPAAAALHGGRGSRHNGGGRRTTTAQNILH